MFGNLNGPTLFVILFIVLLLFGAPKLPALAKSLGQSMKILKKEVRTSEDGEPDQAPPRTPGPDAAGTSTPGAGAPGTAASPGTEGAGAPGPDSVRPDDEGRRPEDGEDRR